ncbi:Acg family FMN-binding oxidoreductase [Nocardia australiensis]|uniref:Acg family FMN-binding oxidoreductase n=1 Tax=Nocardia australiensis TaxID=2887191 RepID=UPI001D154929|nr:NAD(P)H nitroreductase [Nocardia australiensis]
MNRVLTDEVIEKAVLLAGRAPSLHNSQPWRWEFNGTSLRLFSVPGRMLPSADPSGREMLISCGITLDHLHAAMAAAGWRTIITRFPEPTRLRHLATVTFRPSPIVTEGERERADAIVRRHSDRLPFAAPTGWAEFETVLRSTFEPEDALLDVLSAEARTSLASASRLASSLRRYDSWYQAELRWWAGHTVAAAGIPRAALISQEEYKRVDIGRKFPTVIGEPRRTEVTADDSAVLVLSTDRDTPQELLRCGEVLSTVLLECTIAGYATCPLSHLTEVPQSRAIVRRLTGRTQLPQVLIRVGNVPESAEDAPPTPRLPLSDILTRS